MNDVRATFCKARSALTKCTRQATELIRLITKFDDVKKLHKCVFFLSSVSRRQTTITEIKFTLFWGSSYAFLTTSKGNGLRFGSRNKDFKKLTNLKLQDSSSLGHLQSYFFRKFS